MGLGNPGAEYAATRHNVGAWFVEHVAAHYRQTLRFEAKFQGLTAQVAIGHSKCLLFIPTTYMNDSGQAVAAIMQFYKMTAPEILVAHDELDFNAGQIRIKESGGHGGHNGLRDIIHHLSTDQFYRLRIGIGHPGHKDKVTPYVLGKPSTQDFDQIQTALEEGLASLSDIVDGDLDKAMRFLHQ